MNRNIYFCFLMLTVSFLSAQTLSKLPKYSTEQLKSDLKFMQIQIYHAHANPFTALSKRKFDKAFQTVENSLTDSMTVLGFYRKIAPLIRFLDDEHSGLTGVWDSIHNEPVCFPLLIEKQGNNCVIELWKSDKIALKKGQIITKINDEPIESVLKKCELYASGDPNYRTDMAIRHLAEYYFYAYPTSKTFNITLDDAKIYQLAPISFDEWQALLKQKLNAQKKCEDVVTYKTYNDVGYLKSCSFMLRNEKDFEKLDKDLAQIFAQIQQDKIKTLIIDVSKNLGGNSVVGDKFIDYFYDKPYKKYACNWRRSDEYLNLLKSWGVKNAMYEAAKTGTVLHFSSGIVTPDLSLTNRFHGKVIVLVGKNTFSSAMMFGTIIKDNKIATLMGSTPTNGHPTHIGEMYNAKLPNTKLLLLFGVKEWLRPAGKKGKNILEPDVLLEVEKFSDEAELVRTIIEKS